MHCFATLIMEETKAILPISIIKYWFTQIFSVFYPTFAFIRERMLASFIFFNDNISLPISSSIKGALIFWFYIASCQSNFIKAEINSWQATCAVSTAFTGRQNMFPINYDATCMLKCKHIIYNIFLSMVYLVSCDLRKV